MQRRVPVTLITGFLGAGKSTLINEIISRFSEHRFGVVVNEFGEVALESSIIDAGVDEVVELSGGCMCCVTRRDLGRALKKLLAYRGELDRVLLEASGMSDPLPILQTLNKRAIAAGAFLDSVITVVDLARFQELLPEYETVRAQLEHADIVLMSRQGETDDDRRDVAIEQIREIAPRARLAPFESAETLEPLFAGHGYEGRRRSDLELEYSAVKLRHAELHSVLFQSEAPLRIDGLRELLGDLPAGLVRAKGYVYLDGKDGRKHKMLLQVVGRRGNLHASPWKRGEERHTALLFIGNNLDEQNLRTRLEACRKDVS